MLNRGEISPKVVHEWDQASKGLKLPEKVKKKKKKKIIKKLVKKLRSHRMKKEK